MLYFGVDLYYESFKIVALSEGFALLGERYFEFKKHDEFQKWTDSLKREPAEICCWFFDEHKFEKLDDPDSIFPWGDEHHDNSNYVYMVNHRKLINFYQFFYQWIIHEHDFFVNVEKAFILASSVRIFDTELIKPLEENSKSFIRD